MQVKNARDWSPAQLPRCQPCWGPRSKTPGDQVQEQPLSISFLQQGLWQLSAALTGLQTHRDTPGAGALTLRLSGCPPASPQTHLLHSCRGGTLTCLHSAGTGSALPSLQWLNLQGPVQPQEEGKDTGTWLPAAGGRAGSSTPLAPAQHSKAELHLQ